MLDALLFTQVFSAHYMAARLTSPVHDKHFHRVLFRQNVSLAVTFHIGMPTCG